jgi:hypothetical protein
MPPGAFATFTSDIGIIEAKWRATVRFLAFPVRKEEQAMKKGFFLVMIAVLAAARGNTADDVCKPNEPKEQCDFVKSWIDKPQEEVSKANTGVSSNVSPAQSTTKDFLSKLAAALAVPMSGDGARPLTIDYNVPLLNGQRLKLQTVLAKPEPSGDVKQRLGGNASAMTAVKDSLSQLDDVSVSATLDTSTLRLGRSLAPHRDAYRAMLVAVKNQNGDPETFARQFAFLLNHQPQIYGSVLHHERKSIAGPNERSARLTYEMGFLNLNTFRKNAQCRAVTDANAPACATALADLAGDHATVDDPNNRLAMSVEYRAADGVTVALPEYALNFHANNAHSFVYALAYGRNSMMMKNDRIDLAVNYEDTTLSAATDLVTSASLAPSAQAVAAAGAKAVRDRFVASATYTYKVNDMMSMPFSLIYANHASYLGDVGRKLNAHFGISLKMPSGQ